MVALVAAVFGGGQASEQAFTVIAVLVSSWCGVSLWRWQREEPSGTDDLPGTRPTVAHHVPWRGALPAVPGRRHQGRRFAPRQRGRGCTAATQVSVVRSPIHHVRAR